ncbi:MAG: hydrolase [Gemmatimonadetes bacterium GWC2_71_10]|nr:MAG: hydrolase [Gemmatimonadetes bacterium GWC2_71_10]
MELPVDGVRLSGVFTRAAGARGVVVFVHGSGSSRLSPRNRQVADDLIDARFDTLLFDLLTERESLRRDNVFDIPLLAERLAQVTAWLRRYGDVQGLPVGYFGASTGAAAALVAAANQDVGVAAIVSRGGRPDLAGTSLQRVTQPTLLIVGSLDHGVIELNREALGALAGERRLEIVAGASHLFEEPGTLEQVSRLAAAWFTRYLGLTPR